MAVTITKNLTDLWDAETVGTWTGLTPALYDGFNREGTYCLGDAASTATITGYMTFTAFDMTNKAVYIWMFCAGNMDTKANGGMGIVLGDGTNRRAYYVAGSDSTSFQIGVWGCYMVDASNPPSQYNQELGTEAPNFAAITQVGVRFKTLSKALGGADNCFWDVARYGTGIIVKGGGVGTEGTFAQIATDDKSKASGKAYGIVREVQSGVFEVQGSLIFGDDSGTESTYFKDQDVVVVFAGAGSYQLKVVGNSTGTNSFVLGKKIGTGDTAVGSNGCTIQSAAQGLKVDLSTSSANVNTLNIYGSKFYKCSNGVALSTNTAHEFIGNTVDQCGQVTANQCVIRNCTFSGTTHESSDGSALLWNSTINIKNCSFNANTDATNDPHGTEHPATGTFAYDNLQFSGNDYDIENSSSGAVYIDRVNGSNPTTYENTGGGTTTINPLSVSLKVTAKNEAGNNIEDARVAIQRTTSNSMKGAVADDGGVQTDETSAANDATANDMNLVAASGSIDVNDAYYFGGKEPFYKLRINIGQNGVGAWAITWEYYNGTSWATIPDVYDGTNSFKAGTGNKDVVFSPPSNWATTTVQSISTYWIRARITTGDASPTTRAKGTQSWVFLQIMNKLTNASGVAEESYQYLADEEVSIIIRKSTSGATRYFPATTTQTISSSGLTLSWILIQDTIASS